MFIIYIFNKLYYIKINSMYNKIDNINKIK